MRFSASLLFALCIACTGSVAAAGDVYEPHALLYYQLPLSTDAARGKASFGLRLDQTWRAANTAPDFRSLLARPALLELRFGSAGLQALNVAGTDYAQAFRVMRADGEEAGGDEEEADDGPTVGDYLEDIPTGYLIGIALGAVLLSGVAD